MITENYIKMCEQAPQLWNEIEHNGSLIAWRSFRGIVHKCKKRKLEGLATFIPETLVTRTWLKDNEDIMIMETNVEYGGNDPDRGTPIYTLEQLFDMLEKKLQPFYFDFSWNGDYVIETSAQESTFFWNHYCSLNECVLEFIMRRFFNKSWIGEKWVKAK